MDFRLNNNGVNATTAPAQKNDFEPIMGKRWALRKLLNKAGWGVGPNGIKLGSYVNFEPEKNGGRAAIYICPVFTGARDKAAVLAFAGRIEAFLKGPVAQDILHGAPVYVECSELS